jgi:uncharacterized protein with gpF-like domain
MKPEAWRPRVRAEQDFAAALWEAWKASIGAGAGVRSRVIGSAEFLGAYAWQAAKRMITNLYAGQHATWQAAARESGKGPQIYRALQQELAGPVGARMRELVRQNAELISTFPTSVARRAVARGAAAQYAAGGRAGELETWGRLGGLVRSRARLIARTEVSKASSALTEARAEDLDLPWYIWRTSEDERVRLSHRKMNNVLIRWDNPPSPEQLAGVKSTLGHYNAGNCPNDRCYGEPLLRLDQVNWPHRVYYPSQIVWMTWAKFQLINQVVRRAA